MRVLHILDHSLPLQSGYVTRTLGILKAQRDLGWETIQLTTPRQIRSHAPVEEVDGWTFHRTPAPTGMAGRVPMASYWAEMKATESRLEALVREVQPDILHAHSPLLNGYPAVWVRRRHRIPVVYEIRAFWEDAAVDLGTASETGPRVKATRWAETTLMRKADAVVALCHGVRDEILRRGISPDKVTVAPNAIDIERFPPTRVRDVDLARSLGLDGSTVLGFIGSFYHYEGLDLLLKALPRLRPDRPVKLLLVGGGAMEALLRGLTQELKLTDRVVFTGRVKFEEVNRYYDLVDILVFPRKHMRLTDLVTPLKPIEAMAKKRLVVASDVGGHKEMLEDGKTGFLFTANSVEALSASIGGALDRRAEWESLTDAGRRYVERERVWSTVVQQYAPVYRRLCGPT